MDLKKNLFLFGLLLGLRAPAAAPRTIGNEDSSKIPLVDPSPLPLTREGGIGGMGRQKTVLRAPAAAPRTIGNEDSSTNPLIDPTPHKTLSPLPLDRARAKLGDGVERGNVIFIHPDGMSLAHWDAVRLKKAGARGLIHYDKLPFMAVYRGTIRDQITASSNAGGTIHAFGVKTGKKSFGMDKGKKILSAEGKNYSILISAQKKGMKTALVQSGALVEPGTAAFAAQVKDREDGDEIARQVIFSGVDLIFAGGEKYLLPKGTKGRFGEGERKDEKNLIQEAQKLGYTVIYDLKNFKKKSQNSEKILGVFAHNDTYNSYTSEELKKLGLKAYQKKAPTIAQMTQAALEFLKKKEKPFFLVVEEEGTDNFSNRKNSDAFLQAGMRADDAIGKALSFLKENPRTLLLTASDSNASGLLLKDSRSDKVDFKLKDKKHSVSILWAAPFDLHGGVAVKAKGLNAEKVQGLIENTEIYDLMYLTLFGQKPLR